MANTFDKYFGKNQSDINEGKRELVINKVKRGFASATDQLEEMKIDEAEKAENYRVAIANGNTDLIASLADTMVKVKDCDDLIKAIKKEEKDFFKA